MSSELWLNNFNFFFLACVKNRLSHQWGFIELESSICEFLERSLEVSNVCAILDTALAYGLKSLTESCCAFSDANTPSVLQHPTFLNLSPNGVSTLLSRDSFCSAEEKIFEAIVEWTKHQEPETCYNEVLKKIRFPLMNLTTLLEVVRPTGLVSSDLILDAIRAQSNAKVVPLQYRGYLVPEENVAHAKHGATVLKGEMRQAILDGDVQNYDVERGFTRHIIEDNAVAGLCSDVSSGGIVIRLKQQCILNHIRMLLWDKDLRSYSYYIETSIDEEDWVKVCDFTRYHCRSWQNIFFPSRVVRFIKIVGTHNTVNRMFHVVAVQAYYTNKKFNLCPKTGLLMPRHNVASVEHSAFVIEGVSRSRNALINGETTGYDWDSGYTCHQLGSGYITIQLAQPYVISSMRLLLWDCDDRSYSYCIEVSTDHEKWVMVANRSKMKCKSWQVLTFKPIPVVYIRIAGIHNTANEVFHCVHFECPAQIELENSEDEKAKNEQSSNDDAVRGGSGDVTTDNVADNRTEEPGHLEDDPLVDEVEPEPI